jgi:hypothetical protein
MNIDASTSKREQLVLDVRPLLICQPTPQHKAQVENRAIDPASHSARICSRFIPTLRSA